MPDKRAKGGKMKYVKITKPIYRFGELSENARWEVIYREIQDHLDCFPWTDPDLYPEVREATEALRALEGDPDLDVIWEIGISDDPDDYVVPNVVFGNHYKTRKGLQSCYTASRCTRWRSQSLQWDHDFEPKKGLSDLNKQRLETLFVQVSNKLEQDVKNICSKLKENLRAYYRSLDERWVRENCEEQDRWFFGNGKPVPEELVKLSSDSETPK
jgi:hypothetical protein